MEIYYFQQIYKFKDLWLNSRIFFAKLKNFSPKLKVSEIPVSVVAGKSVKKSLNYVALYINFFWNLTLKKDPFI